MSGDRRAELPRPVFLDYVPVHLAFGTSGLRGLVTDITDIEAYANVLGGLRYLLAKGEIAAGSRVPLAGDLRPSTARIIRAAARAIEDAGLVVDHQGTIPTPALAAYAFARREASVMVTGSHIPFDRNGIKISKPAGEVMKDDEPGILEAIHGVRAELYAKSAADSAFDGRGMWKAPPEIDRPSRAAEDAYVERYVNAFGRGALEGWNVMVYQHSAVGRDTLVRILEALGASAVAAGRTETFVPIDTENVTDEELGRLETLLASVEEGRPPFHAIVSTDGDSDRPFVAAVSSRSDAGARVRFMPGDLLGIVVAEYVEARAVAVPISSNDAVERRMRERGVTLETTRIGSPYVIAALDELRARPGASRVVGWEANGGFLTATDLPLANGTLAALPTRDSVLPIVANLHAAKRAGATLAELWDRLPARHGRAGLRDGVPTSVSAGILARLRTAGAPVDVSFEGEVVRATGGPTLDELVASACLASRRTIERFFTAALGFGALVRIHTLDGVRLFFEGGDVAHLRASGNAPQLRIYSNADAQARAARIVDEVLREGGILDAMARELGSRS